MAASPQHKDGHFSGNGDDMEGAEDEPGLNVRLLKERLEMEVGMRREGLRAFAFTMLCLCFAVAFFDSSQPPSKSASRWFLTQHLETARLKEVTTRESLFEAIMSVSGKLRHLTPLSSVYVGDPMAKVLIGEEMEFPAGPVQLPASRHPKLLLEWTLTARVKNNQADDPQPTKKLIVRAYPEGDTSGLSCWAWYTWDYNTYALEYGRNNLDNEYPVAYFEFDKSEITTDGSEANLVAASANSTHLTMRLQNAGELTQEMYDGAVVADCAGDTVLQVGDEDLTISSLIYHPYRLTEVQVSEIEHSGTTLEDMASGMLLENPGSVAEEAEMEAHTTTQSLVEEYGTSNLAISKLTGSLVFMGIEDGMSSTEEVETSTGINATEYETVGTSLPVDNSTGLPSWTAGEGMADPYWPFVENATDMSKRDSTTSVSTSLTSAFAGLMEAGQASFTLSWWSKMDESFDMVFPELLFGSPQTDEIVFQMLHNTDGFDSDDQLNHGYMLSFNSAPWCNNATDFPCMKSPNVACKAPGTGGFYGIWRHLALRFTYGSPEDGIESELEVYSDGRSLCGITFPADPELVPHYMSADDYNVLFMMVMGQSTGDVMAKDARLYPRSLNATEIRQLAQDPNLNECLDLEYNSDSSAWESEFGQTCAVLAGMSVGTDASAPVACRLSEVKLNCPVSCIHEMRPVCHDGSPPLPSQSDSDDVFSLGTSHQQAQLLSPIVHSSTITSSDTLVVASAERSSRRMHSRFTVATLYLELPGVAQTWIELDLSTAALQELTTTSTWLAAGTQANGDWFTLSKDIRHLDVGGVVVSRSAAALFNNTYQTGGIFLKTWDIATGEDFIANCVGLGIDYEALSADMDADSTAQHALIADICEAELTGIATMEDIMMDGDSFELLSTAGFWDAAFEDNLLPLGESSTLYFWAKSDSIADDAIEPRLSAIDTDSNICFAIRGTTAWLQKHNLVAEYEADLVAEPEEEEEEDEDEHDDGPPGPGSTTNEWASGRLSVEIDSSSLDESYEAGSWIFYALSVDVDQRVVRFAINSYVEETTLTDGSWGCNAVQLLLNTGGDVDVSPFRVAGFALPSGSLQRLYLASREDYRTISRGEELSRFKRLTRTERPFQSYNGRMISFAPPTLFQRRVVVSDDTSLECDDDIVRGWNSRQAVVRERKCNFPYFCESELKQLQCVPKEGPSPERFFGQTPVEVEPGKMMFPEFAWTLENDMVVRDGEELHPATDYIDANTVELWFYAAFYVPSSRIATIMKASFDLSDMKITADINFNQIAVLSESQYYAVVGWAIAGILMSAISIFLAFPAAMQEVSEFFRSNHKWLKALHLRRVDPKSSFQSTYRKKISPERVYSSNTTQPDLFDVILNFALIALLVAFLLNQRSNFNEATDVFAAIADIDWGSDLSFEEKIGSFMTLMTSAAEMVVVEERFLTAAFWMLCFCCVRMIVFMRIHPSISSITETFISVGSELSNFLFSFGLIFAFLAFIAHVRFGNMYDEFSTYEQSLITQFSLLIGDSSPDYTEDTLMCIFIIAYVFVCTLSLLNFLLAIVVNGYTQVTERVLENKVAGNFLYDLLGVPVDVMAWVRHRGWPSKLSLLIALQARYPYVFEDEEEVVVCMTREHFRDIVLSAGKGRSTVLDADELFYRYGMMEVLLLTPSEAARENPGKAAPHGHANVKTAWDESTTSQHPLLGGASHQPTSPVSPFNQ